MKKYYKTVHLEEEILDKLNEKKKKEKLDTISEVIKIMMMGGKNGN